MDGTLLVMNADTGEFEDISGLLATWGYAAKRAATASELRHQLKEGTFAAVLMDLDTVALDNRSIRSLAEEFPATPFLGLSSERFHPELKDSIRNHIYACLTKPIDPDELGYWLKCIRADGSG